MKPILFDRNATQFNTNGIGRLDCIECIVTEERNGQYELEMTISQEAEYAGDIGMESIIVVKANDTDPLQAFRVYQITKPIGGIFEVFAHHIRYQLNYIPTMPFSVTASSSACAQTLAGLKNNAVHNCPFTFTTNVTTVASYQQVLPASIGQMLGGVSGSVLDQFGGEYKFDNYNVYLYNHRGVQNPNVTFRYGKDITDLSQEENISNTITGIVPYWTDAEGTEVVTLPEKVVESTYASQYAFRRSVTVDFSSDFEEKPTQSQLRTHAQAYINKAGIGIPKVSIKVSFIDLSKTMEYEDLLSFQSVSLCDIVGISFINLGIDTSAKVVKTEYNVLKERYNSIEIGEVRTGIASTINDTNSSITGLANSTKTNFAKISNELQESIDNATAWLTQSGGVIRALKNEDGEWTDILCMSQTATATSGNVLRLNVNGIGFSSTGWNGTFTQAWTLDGRLVIGGTNVPSITVYDNQNNIIFKADANAMIWNADNSSMDADGNIIANGATLTGATINGGEITNAGNDFKTVINNGEISFYRKTNNTLIGKIKSGTINSYGYLMLTGDYVGVGSGVDTCHTLALQGEEISITTDGGNDSLEIFADDIKVRADNIYVSDNRNTGALYQGRTESLEFWTGGSDTYYDVPYNLDIHENPDGTISWSWDHVNVYVPSSIETRSFVNGIYVNS